MVSIGGFFSMIRTPEYTQKTISLSKGDRIYIFSDGIQDQFGGNGNKKFSFNRLKNTIFEAQSMSMQQQKQYIEQTLEQWRGDESQLDDIVLIGMQI